MCLSTILTWMIEYMYRKLEPGICTSTMVVSMVFLSIVLTSCSTDKSRSTGEVFELVDTSNTGIRFENNLTYEYEFNIYRYRNFYNGGGVAIGDINNDGLPDIYFTGSQVDNRLYLNKGDFEFEDITEKAGVAGAHAWSTGVSMADVNGDGLLDIYVSNSGIVEGDNRKNELYINNGDLTFDEKAEEYGLADDGYSTDAQFFDYDGDGDLDVYVLNNSYRRIGDFDPSNNTRHIRHDTGGDKLYRNDLVSESSEQSPASDSTHPHFTDVTEAADIHESEIGFGLGVSVGDVNRDGLPDIYVSNDFFERDYLYLNDGDGTFTDVLEDRIRSISAASMGGDIADLNGDGYPEIFVSDMLPREEKRLKTVTSFDNWERYQSYISDDYHHQFTRNTLQLNRGPIQTAAWGQNRRSKGSVRFSEVGRFGNVHASDWSWGGLIADFNHDGHRDLFIPNGIYQDLTNADYLENIRDEDTMGRLVSPDSVDFKTLIEMIPSNPVQNYMFAGTSDLRFSEVGTSWGISTPSFSNGAAYGDLNNNGALDLVVNNLNMESFVYRNTTPETHPERAWLQVEIDGRAPNTFGVGTQVTAWFEDRQWFSEQYPVRGFQSSMRPLLHFGLGREVSSAGRLDSLVVNWPRGGKTTLMDVDVNQRVTVTHPAETTEADSNAPLETAPPDTESVADSSERQDERTDSKRQPPLFRKVRPFERSFSWRHEENEYNDFNRQPLLFHMRSTEGPPICTGDVNGSGNEDLFVGGATEQSGRFFFRDENGTVTEVEPPALADDQRSEDTDCALFDADGDGRLDLYVASGGSEFPASSSALMDRLYLNEGNGEFTRSSQMLIQASGGFEPTGAVAAGDYNEDGHVDLFVGARMQPFAFGRPADGHLLLNDGTGRFVEKTDSLMPGLRDLGMITDAEWGDVDGDGALDLVVAGEWMPLTLFRNEDGTFVNRTSEAELDESTGWWKAIELVDLDGDGALDLIGGNHGLNSRFRASPDEPVEMWVDDFDSDSSIEQVISVSKNGDQYPMALKHDLLDAIPTLKEKYPTYESYAGETIRDVFSDEALESAIHYEVEQLESIIGWNDGDGTFSLRSLPREAQLAPMYAIHVPSDRSNGRRTVLMGGNLYEAKPEVGRYDASYGAVLRAGRDTVTSVPPSSSGFFVDGQIRSISALAGDERDLIVVGTNDDSLRVFESR